MSTPERACRSTIIEIPFHLPDLPEQAALGETSLAEGEKVLLGLASANRDETVYRDPGAFRLDRDREPPHVAFGWGTHTCIGAPVVRHAGATLLNTFLDLVAAIELEPGTTPRPYLSPQGNGLDELRLRLTAAGGALGANV